MLVNMNEMLNKAQKEQYGVVAATMFDEDNIRVAIEAAEEEQSPIILNFNLGTKYLLKDIDAKLCIDLARKRASLSNVPIAINADHCRDFKTAMKAVHLGFTSVMFDGSVLPLETNIKKTNEIAKIVHACGMSIEAELGCVGIGSANDLEVLKSMGNKPLESRYTDPCEAEHFVSTTGIDCLAVSIGNAHGPYAKEIIPHIEFELLDDIAKKVSVPLVLHGGSGTGEENLSKACRHGIAKVNLATDLMIAQVKRFEETSTNSFSRFRFEEALEAYKQEIKKYIHIFGSHGKGV